MHPKALVGRAPLGSAGELTPLPTPRMDLKDLLLREGREGEKERKGGKGRGREGRKGKERRRKGGGKGKEMGRKGEGKGEGKWKGSGREERKWKDRKGRVR